MSGIFDEYSGSLTADVLSFNPDAILAPDTLRIRMTRGERRIADELRKQFGSFRRVVIDVDGEKHEFGADSLIRLLEGYEGAGDRLQESYDQVPEQAKCENDSERESCESNYARLFGTPERAARTITRMQMATDLMGCCDADTCPAAFDECWKLDACPMDDYDALLGWLRGDA